jgi:hypothetical protein
MRRNITADNPKLADLENKYAKLDSIVGSMEVAAQNAVYFELLSIGQSLIESEDVKKLVDSTTDKSS